MYENIWNGKTDKVKRKVFIQDYELGGLRMPDLETFVDTQKLKWVNLYTANHDAFWQLTVEALIGVKISIYCY